MPVSVLIFILLLFVLIGGAYPWGRYSAAPPPPQPGPGMPTTPEQRAYYGPWHGYGFGPFVPGGLGLVLVIIVVLALLGRI